MHAWTNHTHATPACTLCYCSTQLILLNCTTIPAIADEKLSKAATTTTITTITTTTTTTTMPDKMRGLESSEWANEPGDPDRSDQKKHDDEARRLKKHQERQKNSAKTRPTLFIDEDPTDFLASIIAGGLECPTSS